VRLSVGVWVMTVSTFFIEWDRKGSCSPRGLRGGTFHLPCSAPRDLGLNRRPQIRTLQISTGLLL